MYLSTPSIFISPALPYRSINQDNQLVGATNESVNSKNITFLIPVNYSLGQNLITLGFKQPMGTFSNPLQVANASLLLMGYDFYPKLQDLSIVGVLALLCAVIGLGKNPYMTDFAQSLFLLGLVNVHFPFHLASLL
jgi:hypothetical protein